MVSIAPNIQVCAKYCVGHTYTPSFAVYSKFRWTRVFSRVRRSRHPCSRSPSRSETPQTSVRHVLTRSRGSVSGGKLYPPCSSQRP